jgi:hypothetical protein
MKKIIIYNISHLAAILFLTFLMSHAELCGQQYKIFQAQGDCIVKLQGKELPCSELTVFEENSEIEIRKGWISLLDGDKKRLTISNPGNYDFGFVRNSFEKQNASIENKFFALLFEMMKVKNTNLMDMPGATVRGNFFSFVEGPLFGDTIIADKIILGFEEPETTPTEFLIYNEDNVIVAHFDSLDSQLIIPIERNWEGSTVRWEAVYVDKIIGASIYIPEESLKFKKMKMLKEFIESIDDFPSDVALKLENLFKQINKIY